MSDLFLRRQCRIRAEFAEMIQARSALLAINADDGVALPNDFSMLTSASVDISLLVARLIDRDFWPDSSIIAQPSALSSDARVGVGRHMAQPQCRRSSQSSIEGGAGTTCNPGKLIVRYPPCLKVI
jgi:hypothetical protein